MTKKDVFVFLNIYLLGLKGILKKNDLYDFRDEIYRLLRESFDYSDFWRRLCQYKLCCYNSVVYRDFIKFMAKIETAVD